MNWIKKNPAQFALALVSALVLGLALMLYTSYSAFAGNFDSVRAPVSPGNKSPALETAEIEKAAAAIQKPNTWTSPTEPEPSNQPVRLFVSDPYVIKDDKLVRPEGGMFFPPVPNWWFAKYGLTFNDASCLTDDPDRDGFENVHEFLGADMVTHVAQTPPYAALGTPSDDSTSPIDPKSHPPYHTRLKLVQITRIPFNLMFMSIDIDRRTKEVNAQINAGGRTYFVPVPGEIPNTKYKTKGYKKIDGPQVDGVASDISELTVTNTETNKDLPLVLGRNTNSPDSYAVVRYLWVAIGGQPTPDMSLKRSQQFKLPPEIDKIYTLEAIGPDTSLGLADNEILIVLPGGGKAKLKVEPK